MTFGSSSTEAYVRKVVEKTQQGKWFDQKTLNVELSNAKHTSNGRMRKTLPTPGELTSILKRASWLEKMVLHDDGGYALGCRYHLKPVEERVEPSSDSIQMQDSDDIRMVSVQSAIRAG